MGSLKIGTTVSVLCYLLPYNNLYVGWPWKLTFFVFVFFFFNIKLKYTSASGSA